MDRLDRRTAMRLQPPRFLKVAESELGLIYIVSVLVFPIALGLAFRSGVPALEKDMGLASWKRADPCVFENT